MVKDIASAAANESVRVSDMFPPQEHVHEPMIPLIESLAFDIPRVIVVNTQNDREYVKGVPTDFEVEIPALCSGNGIQGIACKPLPKAVIAMLLRDRVAPVELELAAYEQGSYDLLLQLILADPWTRSEEQARELLDTILDQPELKEMKQHYKKRELL